ncbi:type ISP restriction/modification enzyme [Algoriphagus sp.]|uniref:type ISP restriction/modification enzyme n=1 Tax=Algoriphagus sp. TaxID=1872435 RepID=UPI002719367B|nr:type ISP restriction/modification enzyme [Algoriphagus sp.]MDO8966333.1 type ISP restriction/modification enzyme [Algoriphagus sp.]MDP3198240.1 type ISP restriction/modification enzyme [Algoriphagus sp.]
MTTADYLHSLNTRYRLGNATEHTFRGDLQNLLESLVPDVSATNEPKRQACGAPDYILTNKKGIPVGYIEAKDIGDADLTGAKKTGNKEQFDRYKGSLDNLIFTDYLEFFYYRNGELATSIRIGVVDQGKILPLPHNFPAFELLIKEFTTHIGQTIKSSKKLAEMMAGKARLLANVIEAALESDVEHQDNSTLKEQMSAFKEILIHDITPKQFSDVYAQTIAYGMFAARLYDTSLDTFSRQEAAELIPKSNPFLRKLFQYIAGYDLDERITWIVDALADIFRAADVQAILKNFGKATKMEDPIIHFYEDFLTQYDPKLRKQRGVWYTPHPVVNFIIRAVDEILITEFDLPMGLADTSKTKIKVPIPTHDKRFAGGMREVEQEVHRVQFLDPATGTGTFVAEAIQQIYDKMKGQQGLWNSYVENHLLPRINGFELLMASYAMAHLKLDLLLKQTGYSGTKNQRFRIYLTNSLEEYHKDTGTLFANWLSAEASEANQIKRDAPVMIVAGNPPYSGESSNKGEWIMNLMEDYKKEPGGKEKLKERNPKWINDDYVKFIRYGQYFIEKNGSGILAFINPHGFLDNPTFRGMRWNLLKTFDKIYTINLHGNAKKKETAIDGSKDENVFDIQQGVSINFFIKTGLKKEIDLGKAYSFSVYGLRNDKYDFLNSNSLNSISLEEVSPSSPYFYLLKKDFSLEDQYSAGFICNDLFLINGNGLTTAHDSFVVKDTSKELLKMYSDFQNTERNEDLLHSKFNVKKKEGWSILEGYDNIKNEKNLEKFIKDYSYRPFDDKFIFYEDKLVWRTVRKVMDHYNLHSNIGLIIGRQGHVVGNMEWNLCFITKKMTDFNFYYRGGGVSFPLYCINPVNSQLSLLNQVTRTPNLNMEIVDQIAKGLGLTFESEKSEADGSFAPIDLLDYIYAVLHSPTYRETYKEFLKIDFPRVPYPTDADMFWKLVALGGELRQLHLMESPTLAQFITQYPVGGENEVEKIRFENLSGLEDLTGLATGRVYINSDQYFDSVPEVAWNFYIGGYQPAQKWLKDRKGRILDFEDIMHYQRIIKALTETERVMGEIDGIEII